MTDDRQLSRLGDALEDAVRADLATTCGTATTARRAPRRHRRPAWAHGRRLALVGVVLAVAIPGIAIGADALLSPDEVAQGMPAGTLALAGTEPTCVVVEEGVEYRCTLARAPFPEFDDWLGTVESTVGPDNRVNGGCRALDHEGTEWSCYLGQAAVEQEIIGESLLGQESSGPAVG
jgi:hypothetical protein